MAFAALAGYAVAQAALLVWSFAFAGTRDARTWIPRALLAGMIYDNGVLLLGNAGAGSAWYAAASTGRFVIHAAVLPLLIPYALSALRAGAVPLAGRRGFVVFCWLVTLAAWGHGFLLDVGRLELVPQEVFGHLRFTSASALPPFGTIAVNVLLIPMAFVLWRRTGTPFLLAGALFILLCNAAVGPQPWGYLAGNGAEVVFMFCVLATERFLIRRNA